MERMQSTAARWRNHGYDLDITELVYLGDRNEAATYLADHGWQVSGYAVNELLTANGLSPFDDDMPFVNIRYVSGTRTGGDR